MVPSGVVRCERGQDPFHIFFGGCRIVFQELDLRVPHGRRNGICPGEIQFVFLQDLFCLIRIAGENQCVDLAFIGFSFSDRVSELPRFLQIMFKEADRGRIIPALVCFVSGSFIPGFCKENRRDHQ